jgi:hypothetical protein
MTIDRERLRAACPKVTSHVFADGPLAGETFYVRRMSAREHGEWLTHLFKLPQEDHVSAGGLLRVAMSWCDEAGKLLFDAGNAADMDELGSLDYQITAAVELAASGDKAEHMQAADAAKKN